MLPVYLNPDYGHCGNIVAIAEKCLDVSTAEIEIIERTDF